MPGCQTGTATRAPGGRTLSPAYQRLACQVSFSGRSPLKTGFLRCFLFAAAAFAAVDVNQAARADLDGINGIGPGLSQRILAERDKGEFKDWLT